MSVEPAADDLALAKARRGLAAVACIVGFGLVVSVVYAVVGIGIPCVFKLLTGWDCPFCGGTRMGAALLRGDLRAAISYNPAVFVFGVLVGLRAVGWAVELIRVKPFPPLPHQLQRLVAWAARRWLPIGAVIAVIYTLARNLA